ncbi:hypothetical protein MPH_13779 [Macrophomina phaseolina MS6]|uniref:Hydrophobin n=1 Tax=Macrophomina phaseolina (strain MS6) TaxID=1126212 RepID=K2R8K2_MACPH|nr:hypothetical protein MPH_13779 [Macrophomina phaseolina MS6]
MKASTICSTIISMAVVASAVPTAENKIEARTGKTLGSASQTCSANQVVSCCNSSNKESSAGLISLLLGPILGNGCTGIGATILNVLSPLDTDQVCGNENTVKCCEGSKNSGLVVVDLSCTDIL